MLILLIHALLCDLSVSCLCSQHSGSCHVVMCAMVQPEALLQLSRHQWYVPGVLKPQDK